MRNALLAWIGILAAISAQVPEQIIRPVLAEPSNPPGPAIEHLVVPTEGALQGLHDPWVLALYPAARPKGEPRPAVLDDSRDDDLLGQLGQKLRERRRERQRGDAKTSATAPEGAVRQSGISNQTLRHQGLTRNYDLQVPDGGGRGGDMPLVIVLHGMLGNAEDFAEITDWFEKGRREGFVVAFPNGTPRLGNRNVWNAGGCCGPANRKNVDDVGFVAAMIDDIGRKAPIDESKVFVTGFSNGAMMTHRIGCELADRVAAVAIHSGTLGIGDCRPARPIRMLQIHGTDDDQVPIDGIKRRNDDFSFMSVPASMDIWRRADGCSPRATTSNPARGVQCTIHSDCRGGASVSFCMVDGLGHAWAGGSKDRGRGFSATDFIWNFFSSGRI